MVDLGFLGRFDLVVPSWYRFYPVELRESDRAMLAEFGITDEADLSAIEQLRRDFAETFAPCGEFPTQYPDTLGDKSDG